MKIYFDGCSMTRGGLFLGKNWETDRWSKILCDELGAEEYNYADGGGSNQRILRQLTTHNIKDYDLAIIQLTMPERLEYHDGNIFQKISPSISQNSKKIYNLNWFWNTYYKQVYHDAYGDSMEKMVYESVKCICAVNKVPLVLMSGWHDTKLSYDLMITSKIFDGKYDPVGGTRPPYDAHPDLLSQPFIADDIINFINTTSVL
tara:strand:- start:1625 stop:2233 length:609 start_codon:yes stop_codon:yes gene_type:complete